MAQSHLRDALQTKATSQREAIPGSDQIENSAGGFAFGIDDFSHLRRFLILGTEGGTYYASERDLTRENAELLLHCIREDARRAVDVIVQISHEGVAPKNEYAIWALAACAGLADADGRRYALDALPDVCRTGTHVLQFADFVYAFRGWGRQLRRAIARWYANEDVARLAYQVIKYRDRAGYTHRDLLRLAHPARMVGSGNPRVDGITDQHAALYDWIVRRRGILHDGAVMVDENPLRIVEGFERAQRAETPTQTAVLVREYGLPREALKTEHLTSPEVWDALLEDMPMTALIRNLATMTRVGLIAPLSDGERRIVEQLGDAERIADARVHPLGVLSALMTYVAGRSTRGSHEWIPSRAVVDALDAAFYLAFRSVEPSGKRHLLALDVSGSMNSGTVGGVVGLTPRMASSALALVTAASEPAYEAVAFTGRGGYWADAGSTSLMPLPLSPRERLDDVVLRTQGLPFGRTDCALPMIYAIEHGREVDVFVVYTDNETWAGDVHPVQALRAYRERSGIAARLIVVGLTATEFSIADPSDAGMLDVVGFDSAAPALMAAFTRGEV